VDRVPLRHGVYLPPFNELSDPHVLMSLAELSEKTGWDGFFLWDHVLRRPEEAPTVADAWVSLAGVACVTERLRLGAMVTPLARRRPQVVARQAVTLDHLSSGRLVLGLGLGVDSTGELSRFGELVDPVRRGDLFDEGADLLVQLMSGQQVEHRGRYFTADGVRFLPRPVQEPHIPVWCAAVGRAGRAGGRTGPAARTVRRAASYDGLFLIEAGPNELERAMAIVSAERGSTEGFDLAVLAEPTLPRETAEALGATWRMLSVGPDVPLVEARARIAAGPPD
jgi:alkanesulfonate monooxygenase SsuD/methylene tetrahydromethanopterin reductase-like flavin-dependent oxidoreductase (luciferase family)